MSLRIYFKIVTSAVNDVVGVANTAQEQAMSTLDSLGPTIKKHAAEAGAAVSDATKNFVGASYDTVVPVVRKTSSDAVSLMQNGSIAAKASAMTTYSAVTSTDAVSSMRDGADSTHKYINSKYSDLSGSLSEALPGLKSSYDHGVQKSADFIVNGRTAMEKHVNRQDAIAAASVVGGVVLCTVLAPIVAPVAVSAFGFTSGGVAAGSLAAGAQSAAGSIAAGSAFAVCQSIGAGGALPVVGYLGAAGVGAVMGGVRAIVSQANSVADDLPAPISTRAKL